MLHAGDARIAAPRDEDIESQVEKLRSKGFDLEMEGHFSTHFGIGIKENEDGTCVMTQKGLIDKIIKEAKMTDFNPNETPAATKASGSDKEGKPWDQKQWSCASIAGVSLCILNNT